MYHSHIRIVHRGTPCFTGNKARSKGFLPHGGSSWIANTKWEHALGMNGLLRAPYHSQKSNLPAHSLRESKVISKRIVNVSGVFFFFCPYILISLCHVICRLWMLMNLGSRTILHWHEPVVATTDLPPLVQCVESLFQFSSIYTFMLE